MIRRGFTVVELIITITIMGILLTLAVVSLNATQVNGRDAERKGDMESFAMNLESLYRGKYLTEDALSGGTYLGYAFLNDSSLKVSLPDLDLKNTRAPGVALTDPISIRAATNNVQTPDGVQPRPTLTTYVYQPLTTSGARCMDPVLIAPDTCRKFNLYYLQESDNTVQMITSKNQ